MSQQDQEQLSKNARKTMVQNQRTLCEMSYEDPQLSQILEGNIYTK